MIYIIGHVKPDLDSAVSAVALKYLFNNVSCFERTNSTPVLASNANFETTKMFEKFKVDLPKTLASEQINKKDTFVLVDHNEISQRLTGITDDQVTDIFDHHKINLKTTKPIFITIKPWGSSSTLCWWWMEVSNLKPDKSLAGLMMAAIISDTSGFKSPTTTETDKKAFKDLNKIAKIADIEKLTLDIFKAKSYIGNLSDQQILLKDYKIYDFTGKKVLINQLETVLQDDLLKKTDVFINELIKIKTNMKLDHAFCLITDVLKLNSKCFVTVKDEPLLQKSFPKAKNIKKGVYDLGPIMSRKKEVAPAVEKALV
ncbi:DHH family phosphoesterase [Patescibacteria group bacterium]